MLNLLLLALQQANLTPSGEEWAAPFQAASRGAVGATSAAEAARALAESRAPEAMQVRLAYYDAAWSTDEGMQVRDSFYAGMLLAHSLEEGNLLALAAADPLRSPALRRLCLQALAESEALVESALLFAAPLRSSAADERRAWQIAAGRCLSQERVLFTLTATAAQARRALLDAGPPYLGHANLSDWTDEEWEAIRQAALRAKDPADRADALRVLATRRSAQGAFLEAAAEALKDDDRVLRAAVLQGAAECDAYEAAPLIIDFLEQAAEVKDSRWVEEASESLRRLTGLSFGPKPEVWRHWWSTRGRLWLEGRQAGQVPEAPADGVQRDHESASSSARIFGLPVDSTRVALLIDGSDRMLKSRIGSLSAAEAVAEEVKAFCAALPAGSRFQVWMVEDQPLALFPKAMPANRTNRNQAALFLQNRGFQARPALVEALAAAMLDPIVDTIILIGSGSSHAGLHADPAFVLAEAQRLSRRHGVKIHTILAAEGGPPASFMRELAESTGGRSLRTLYK